MGKVSRSIASPGPRKADIARALFSTTQWKVLQLLFGQPRRSYFASELIELAGCGSGAVQRELARLAESGLVTHERIGRQRHYRANPRSPVFKELRGIVTKTGGIPELLRAALAPMGKRLDLALLYGSIARHEAGGESDIDLLLVGDQILLEELYSLLESPERALRRKISPALYSRQEFNRRRKTRNPFLTKVLAGPTVSIVGNLHDLEGAG